MEPDVPHGEISIAASTSIFISALSLTIIPSCCLSPIHWYAALLDGEVVIDLNENYPKQTFRNRFEIIGVNGRQVLTIPVEGQKGMKIPVKEIKIAEGTWRKTYLHAIRSAYGRSAFFEYYIDVITQIFCGSQQYLHTFNAEILEWSLAAMKIAPTSFNPRFNTDLVFPFEKIQSGEQRDLRLDFEPSAIWPPLPPYPQVFGDRHGFQGNLSILDLLMNKGPGAVDYLLLIKNGGHSL